MSNNRALVIGAGFAGLATATSLAHEGWQVTLLEKNNSFGGRARRFRAEGFTFDMGPSWYWMPDVFERYFNRFGKSVSDYYQLDRLDPSYSVYFPDEHIHIPASAEELGQLLETYEPGAAKGLKQFLDEAAYKYQVGIHELVYKPGRSLSEFADLGLLRDVLRMDIFKSMSNHLRTFFKHPKILQLLEFPVLFLGAMPQKTPALYSMMNYADLQLGTWYPKNGMHSIVEAMVALAEEKGVTLVSEAEVTAFTYQGKQVTGAQTAKGSYEADVVVVSGDYAHFDKNVVEPAYRHYSEKYWDSRVLAPSCLLYYLGIEGELPELLHHNLFFDVPFMPHAEAIYTDPSWPKEPMFYASVTSKTDPTAAPAGHENLFLLIPVAPGMEETDELQEQYLDVLLQRIEQRTGTKNLKQRIVYRRDYAFRDFVSDYHAFKGNAYGLANTLRQTAILKPSMKNKHLKNLYYAGQLTVPGPGVPPSLISGQVVASEVVKEFGKPKASEHASAV